MAFVYTAGAKSIFCLFCQKEEAITDDMDDRIREKLKTGDVKVSEPKQ